MTRMGPRDKRYAIRNTNDTNGTPLFGAVSDRAADIREKIEQFV